MKISILFIISALLSAAGAPPVERLFDNKLSATARAAACFELRGAKDADSLSAMARALEDPVLLSCAVENLRVAAAVAPLREALSSKNEQVRAAAARVLGSFRDPDLLEPLARAAQDDNMLVATNALAGLSQYQDAAAVPYLAAVAQKGGMVGDMAIDRLAELDPPRALTVARELLGSQQVPDRLYAMRVIGAHGARGDLPALRKIAESGQEDLAQRTRGFGLMPPISLSRAAQTAIQAIESR
jgi:HEAT repeat protein